MGIAGRSLAISATSSTLAVLICLPLAAVIHFNKFPGKRTLINIVQTLFSLPTVAVGPRGARNVTVTIQAMQARTPAVLKHT